jgi:lipopolysaccharide export system protein LptC
VAAPNLARLRVPLALVVLLGLGWIVYQTIHAGEDIPPPPAQTQMQLNGGSANDKRIDGKSWSLDYDSATLSPDGSIATIERVHHGTILRDGKPYMHMTAQHVTANLAINDFTVTGPVTFTEVGGQQRKLETNGAHYTGATHVLHLDQPTTIHDGLVTFHVSTADVNFTTGDTKLGAIRGTM